MYSQVYAPVANTAVLTILNLNVIAEDVKNAIIEKMGMSACQIRCLRCNHCSANKCGNRS